MPLNTPPPNNTNKTKKKFQSKKQPKSEMEIDQIKNGRKLLML